MRDNAKIKRIEAKQQDVQQGLTKVTTINTNQKIRYTDKSEMDSHLYKLCGADIIKYIGKGRDAGFYPESDPELFHPFVHCHIFRTADSDGKIHTKSVAMSGHYHVLELKYDEKNPENAPEIVAMSGPMQSVHKKIKGRVVVVDEPINHYDFHTHDIEYLKSEKIQARTTNQDAARFLAQEANKTPINPVT